MPTRNSQYPDLNAVPEGTALQVSIKLSGIKQWEIAQRVGISDSHLSRVLSGQRPLDDILAKKIRDAIDAGRAA